MEMPSPRDRARFWSYVQIGLPARCWRWTGDRDRDGYGRVGMRGHMQQAHRVAWALTHDRWPRPCALHICDNPWCVNPSHIYEGTPADNIRDAVVRGRFKPGRSPGEANPMAKLTAADVASIRAAYVRGSSTAGLAALARRFGVSTSAVHLITSGKKWRCTL